MNECRDLVRPGHWKRGKLLCSKPADTMIVAILADGQRVEHGIRCEYHAKRLANRFAQGNRIKLVSVSL